MTSPDFSEYVDLTLYDRNPDDLMDEMLDHGRQILPQWDPSVGNIETVMVETFANQSAALLAGFNRLPDGILEGMLNLFGITRSDGNAASATVTLTAVDTAGYMIPADTEFAYFASETAYVYYLAADAAIPNGSTEASATIVAREVGEEFNSPPSGSLLQVLTATPFLTSAVLATAPTGGSDTETDDQYFARAVNTVASYSTALVTPSQIQAHVLDDYPEVFRCQVYDRRRYYDRDTTASTYTTHNGYVLIAVGGSNSDQSVLTDIPIDATTLSAIKTDVEGRSSVGLIADVMTAELASIDVSATVVAKDGVEVGAVGSLIVAALDNYLDPDAWDWSSTHVRTNEIISLIDQVDGVDYVVSVSLAGSDIAGYGSDTTSVDGSDVRLNHLGTLTVSGSHSVTVNSLSGTESDIVTS